MKTHDVIIVGGGLAGLTAAHALKDLDVLVLEREGRAGGRVLTRTKNGVAYDLGAVFAIDPPDEVTAPPLVTESDRIGLFAAGRMRWGSSVDACLEGLEPEARARGLGAFFRVIHPATLAETHPHRHQDARVKFNTRHYAAGNDAVVERLATGLGKRLRLDTEVLSIEEKSGHVEVATGDGVLTARAVICATTGPVARALITSLTNDRCRVFLENLRWGQGTVVALGLSGADLPDFSYVVSPDLKVNTVLKHRGVGGAPDVLLAYYVGEGPTDLAQVLSDLRALKIGPIHEAQVVFTDLHRWDAVGPVISEESYGQWDAWEARACERVFLAGDYTFVDPANVMPFGTAQAMASGTRSAAQVREYLDVPRETERFRSEYLVETTMYRLAGERPSFVQTKSECNVAYWGLVLQAEKDPALAQYLTRSARGALWEYQTGFGVTAEDSLLVCEGLHATGADIRPSLERLIALFYLPKLGAFQTLSEQRNEVKDCAQGRSAYWFGPSLDATAHAGYLLHATGMRPDIVAACARYVATQPLQSTWFPSKLVTLFQTVRLLAATSRDVAPGIERLRASQSLDGSFNGSVIDTSAAVLTLRAAGVRDTAVDRARAWLESRRPWAGEPVLYYWFEVGPTEKLFFHCRDKGRITAAWATLALSDAVPHEVPNEARNP